jgi:hypothetical protein
MSWLIKRNLNTFGLSLEWDGGMVLVKDKEHVLDVRSAKTGKESGKVMEELEDEFMGICGAMV